MPEGGCVIRIPALLILTSSWLLASLDLPLHGPIPVPRPDTSTETPVNPPAAVEGKTDETDKGADDKAEKKDKPGDGATEKPADTYVPPPIETEDPARFAACTAELKAMGVEFKEEKRIDDGGGCGIDRPLTVTALGNGIKLSPTGTLRCAAAVNLARWTRDVVTPMLKKSQPAETLAEVNQASTYICRKRNGAETGKISEHAHGNAVDIAGFTFKSGKTFTIAPREEDSTLNGAFQRSIATAACLYFSTVLDPGSDKAHETHLHLDTLKRKGGYRYCW